MLKLYLKHVLIFTLDMSDFFTLVLLFAGCGGEFSNFRPVPLDPQQAMDVGREDSVEVEEQVRSTFPLQSFMLLSQQSSKDDMVGSWIS